MYEREKSRSVKKAQKTDERKKSRSAGARKRERKSAIFRAKKRARKRTRKELPPGARSWKKSACQLYIRHPTLTSLIPISEQNMSD
jgi:hypothetical protein